MGMCKAGNTPLHQLRGVDAMRTYGVDRAFAFDRHFDDEGFAIL